MTLTNVGSKVQGRQATRLHNKGTRGAMKKFIIDVWKCLRLRMSNFSGALKKVRNNMARKAEYSDLIRFRTAAATPECDRLKQAEEHEARLTRVLAHQRFWEDQRTLSTAARYFIPYQTADWSSFGGLPCLTDDARANLMQQI